MQLSSAINANIYLEVVKLLFCEIYLSLVLNITEHFNDILIWQHHRVWWRKNLHSSFSKSPKNKFSGNFCEIIPTKLNFALYLRVLSWISTWHNNRNLNNSLVNSTALTNFIDSQTCSWHFFFSCQKNSCFLIDTDILLMRRAMHAANFVTSSQNFHSNFVKSVIDMKNS